MSAPPRPLSAESHPPPAPILIVDDDAPMAAGLKALVEKEGHHADTADSAERALELLNQRSYALVLSDVRMPGASGLELLAAIREIDAELPVVLLTGFATVANAVAAIQQGAFDYLPKPFKIDDVRIVVRRALERRSLVTEVAFLRREVVRRFAFGEVVAGAAFHAVLERAQKVAASNASILITGETGTGKELVAKAIHYASPRKDRPFVAVNCSALSQGLIESELFGHVRGAFTGALEHKTGYFEVADGGSLFLDEVGEIPAAVQSKLLRVLQDGTFQRVGETRARTASVRVIAATNRDLEVDMRSGEFREDLYYRLAVVHLRLPPLRERKDDIRALAMHFLTRFARELNKPVTAIPEPLWTRLENYAWPGNVRELQNAIERGVLLADSGDLSDEALPGKPGAAPTRDQDGELVTLAEHERRHIERVLTAAKGNKNLAAKILGVTRRSIYRKLEKHELQS